MQLTCSNLGEPGGAGVEVDGLEADDLPRLCALTDGHTHQRVLLLWDHQHLEHLQGAGEGEVKVLRRRKKELFKPILILFKWKGRTVSVV